MPLLPAATFRDQAEEWFTLTVLAARLLDDLANQAVVAAIEGDRDVQRQLAAALLPYAAHLLEAVDLSSPSWFGAWAQLVPALAAQVVWPNSEAGEVSEAAQRSAAVQEGLLRLLRMLPPWGKPPRSHCPSWQSVCVPLYSSKAAAVAASSAFGVRDRVPQAQLQLNVQQQGLSRLLALLPVTVDLLTASAGQLDAPLASTGGKDLLLASPLLVYGGALIELLVLMAAASEFLDREQELGAQPGELAAAAEAALRLAAQAAVLAQPLGSRTTREATRGGVVLAERIFACLLRAAKQEVSAAPEPGAVRPSLQAQLNFVCTASKFVCTALVRDGGGSSGGEVSGMELYMMACQLMEWSNLLLTSHVHAGIIPQGRAPLTPAEKRWA